MAGEASILKKASPVYLLELKLQEWMKQQPEWLLIVNMPRAERRAAMKELANRLYTIPIMDGANTVPRVVRRKAARSLAHATRTGQLTEMVADALVEAARLEEERLQEQARAEDAAYEAHQEAALEALGAPESDVQEPDAPEDDPKAFEGSEPVVGYMESEDPGADPGDVIGFIETDETTES